MSFTEFKSVKFLDSEQVYITYIIYKQYIIREFIFEYVLMKKPKAKIFNYKLSLLNKNESYLIFIEHQSWMKFYLIIFF